MFVSPCICVPFRLRLQDIAFNWVSALIDKSKHLSNTDLLSWAQTYPTAICLALFCLFLIIPAIYFTGYWQLRRDGHDPGSSLSARAKQQRSARKVPISYLQEDGVNLSPPEWEDAEADTFLLQPPALLHHGLHSNSRPSISISNHHMAANNPSAHGRDIASASKPQRPLLYRPVSGATQASSEGEADAEAADKTHQAWLLGGNKCLDGRKSEPLPSFLNSHPLPPNAKINRIESCSSLTASSTAMSARQSSIPVGVGTAVINTRCVGVQVVWEYQ